jgi:Protein of unknown function (DUF3025)
MQVDWAQPWMGPWRVPGAAISAQVADGVPLHAALNAVATAPVRFVPEGQLPADTPYEQFIFDTGQCPVRPGLHDFFNALVWMRFPQAKAALNRLQSAQIARAGIGARRGPVRDAITVFDENGALLQAPPTLWEALQARAWRRLFVELRPLWRSARLTIFGHALLEQLAAPRKGLTAHVWRAEAPLDADADGWLARRCTEQVLAAKPFAPLPVLGVPGWWAANENFSFYDDSLVFRPRKTREPTPTTTSAGPARS